MTIEFNAYVFGDIGVQLSMRLRVDLGLDSGTTPYVNKRFRVSVH